MLTNGESIQCAKNFRFERAAKERGFGESEVFTIPAIGGKENSGDRPSFSMRAAKGGLWFDRKGGEERLREPEAKDCDRRQREYR